MSGIVNTVKDTANYISDTITGQSAEAKAEVNKEVMKSDQTSIGQKVDAAGDYLGNKKDQHSSEASAELNKQKASHN